MNCLLQFRDKSHFKKYSHGILLQLKKRLDLLLVLAAGFLIARVILYTTNTNLRDPRSKYIVIVRVFLVTLGVAIAVLLKTYARKLKKHFGVLNIVLDISLMISQLHLYPLIDNIIIDELDHLSIFLWGWAASLHAVATYSLFVNWWMRAVTAIFQMTFFLVFMGKLDKDSSHLAGSFVQALNSLIFYLFVTYSDEKYQRKDFLEKRRISENYEALLKIFDDISQGITITDLDYREIYSNKTINVMFDKTPGAWNVKDLFAEFSVKAIFPLTDWISSARLQRTEENLMVKAIVLLMA